MISTYAAAQPRSALECCEAHLQRNQFRWLVTGSAGFIGSHLVQRLLELNQLVTSVDNFSAGQPRNLEDVAMLVGPNRARAHRFIEGDIRDLELCRRLTANADFVLHQAALGSVPRSVHDPIAAHRSNVDGFLNILIACKEANVRRLVYAGSSAVYGDHAGLPKVEAIIGRPLSPYAGTKYVNELYAEIFARCYGLSSIGLRYFNVFGPRQDPDTPYAAV